AQSVTPQQGNIQSKIAEQSRRMLETRDAESSVKQEGPAVVSDPLNRRELPPAGGPTVALKSIDFEPASAFLSDAELEASAVKYRSHHVDFSRIFAWVRDVYDLYAVTDEGTAAEILPYEHLN